MGYSTLKAALDAVVKTNGRQQITGSNLNGVMTTLLQGVDIMDRSNPADTSGMNHVVLKKNGTFSSQVTGTNTIYEIRDQFVLSSNFTMPTGCVLLFNGGEISGTGTLTFSETIILGNAKITCGFAGTIPGLVHAEWFGMVAGDQSFDNSPIIQKVCRVFPFVEIDGDDYYCATPIDLSTNALVSLSVYANLHYVTTGSDTFLTFSGMLDVRIYGKIIGPVANNTGGSDRTIGIKFKDVNDSRIYVKRVNSFYTNIQVYSGTDAIGNAYNNYEFGELLGANILLELKADDPGWVTSNRFSIQRMTQFGGQTKVETAILIHADVSGFSDNIFEKLTIEGVRDSEPVKLINVNRVSFYNVRNEANNANFFYANHAVQIKARFNYGFPSVRTEPGKQCHILNEYDHFAPYEPLGGAIHIPGGSNRHLLFNAIDSSKAQSINYSPLFYIPVGFIVPVTRREFIFTSKDAFELSIVYYDASMNIITRDAQYMPSGVVTFKNSSTINNGYVTTSSATLQSVAFPTLPEGCTFIGYFFRVTKSKTYFNGESPLFSIPTDLAATIDKSMLTYGAFVDHNKYGTTAQRPTFAEDYRQYLVGFEYFDTSLGKPIYASSIASDGTATWVDATGAAV